jgi:hypothetical protein
MLTRRFVLPTSLWTELPTKRAESYVGQTVLVFESGHAE